MKPKKKGQTETQIPISPFFRKREWRNEPDVDTAIKQKGFQVATPRKNTYLNTSRLVKILNLRRKIKG